jgi:hypothetical protein
MTSDRFWMVYGAGQGAPTARHKSFDSARTEAERLARMVPGVRFFILETVSNSSICGPATLMTKSHSEEPRHERWTQQPRTDRA